MLFNTGTEFSSEFGNETCETVFEASKLLVSLIMVFLLYLLYCGLTSVLNVFCLQLAIFLEVELKTSRVFDAYFALSVTVKMQIANLTLCNQVGLTEATRTKSMNTKCWANSIGSCSGGTSGEHVFSKGLFPGNAVTIKGLHWCKDEPITVGINSITKNILCSNHNSELSTLDSEAIHAFKIFREKYSVPQEPRSLLKILQEKPPTINGPLFERWFLKTLINFATNGPYLIGLDGQVPGVAPKNLVEVAYGKKSFESGAGIAALVSIGMKLNFGDRVGYSPLLEDGIRIVGGFFVFFGFYIYLSLDGDRVPIQLAEVPGLPEGCIVKGILKPLKKIQMNLGGFTVTTAELLWD